MSNKILHKRSLTTGSIPTTSSLLVGEIALNVADGKVYIHKSGSQGQSIESAITSNSTSSIGILTLSGSLILSGSPDINSGSVFDVATDNISFDFDSLAFSGSAEITGSLIVTGGITGSLSGSASTAISASYALTSSFVQTAQTASYVLQAVSASFATSASFAVSASYLEGGVTIDTGSLVTTASFNAFTSSYTTGSFTGSFIGDGSGLTGVGAAEYIRRSDYTSSLDININYLYLGQAILGSSESADVWDISRLAISSSGATLTQTTSSAAWVNRYSYSYL